jgi:septal ring factor EnvC (AmiA/AmiB activator)
LIACGTAGLAAEPQAPAASPEAAGARLKELESALAKGQLDRAKISQKEAALDNELAKTRETMVTAARAIQEREDSLSEFEARLADLDRLERNKERALDIKQRQMAGVLAALQRLAFRPTEALIAQPTSPADTVRSAILLRDMVPELKSEAAGIKTDLENLSALKTDVAEQKRQVDAATAHLDQEHQNLAMLYSRMQTLQTQNRTEGEETDKKITDLASQAHDLKDLLARLDAEQKARQQAEAAKRAASRKVAALPAARSFPKADGAMPIPARGRVIIGFGQLDDQGAPSKGITIATRADAQVVAPFDGTVAFAGPFRGYGLLLIIEHSEGYHSLLAGMARIDSTVGQHLLAGEPVGIMGQADSKPLLYVELRHEGQPVNPLPWLTAHKTKVTG